MKKTFLFCTRPIFFLTELAPVALLILAICYNSKSAGFFKLYPLIAVLCIGIILIFLYFFRLISISTEEIQTIGLFSSKDHALIDKGKTLTFIIKKNGAIKVELSEKTSNSSFSWNQDASLPLVDMNLYRERAIGKKVAVTRVLKYFSVPKDDYSEIFFNESFRKEYENYNLICYNESDERHIKIEFTQTI